MKESIDWSTNGVMARNNKEIMGMVQTITVEI